MGVICKRALVIYSDDKNALQTFQVYLGYFNDQ